MLASFKAFGTLNLKSDSRSPLVKVFLISSKSERDVLLTVSKACEMSDLFLFHSLKLLRNKFSGWSMLLSPNKRFNTFSQCTIIRQMQIMQISTDCWFSASKVGAASACCLPELAQLKDGLLEKLWIGGHGRGRRGRTKKQNFPRK